MIWIEVAADAYRAYGDEVNWKNYQGNPMPLWGDLPEPIQRAWVAAVRSVFRNLVDEGVMDIKAARA